MRRQDIYVAFAAFGLPGSLWADPVDVPYVFVAGEPAVASEVNANFSAIATGINENVAALELAVDDNRALMQTAADDNQSRFAALSVTDDSLWSVFEGLEDTLGIEPLSADLTLSGLLRAAPDLGISFPTSNAAPFGFLTTYHDYNGVRDNALYYGYNTGPNNKQVIASEPRLVWNMEANYAPQPGANWMEVNLDYTNSSGTFWKRFLAFYLDRNAPAPDGAWSFVGGEIRLENPINQQQFAFQLRSDDTRRTVVRYGGLGRRRLQIGYDGTWISPDAIDIGPSSLTTSELSIMRSVSLEDGETAIVLLWKNGQLQETRQVEVGPPDSGGAGYRALRVTN